MTPTTPSADALECIAQAAAALDLLDRRPLAAWLMRTHAALSAPPTTPPADTVQLLRCAMFYVPSGSPLGLRINAALGNLPPEITLADAVGGGREDVLQQMRAAVATGFPNLAMSYVQTWIDMLISPASDAPAKEKNDAS